ARLAEQGVTVRAMADPSPQRRAFVYVDGAGERTITVLGEKLRPSGGDSRLPWRELAEADAAYFVSGDDEALRAARTARVLVDAYGCGDSFAAGLTFALARGDAPEQAIPFAARCGATVLTGRGPYTSQLTAAEL